MSNSGARVYVVDDDPFARDGIADLIRSAGLTAETFASGEEFLGAPRPKVPSCLVLDVNLPGVNGLDLQQELAKWDVQVPIVFLTGHGDIPMTVRAVKAGAANFLTKPFDGEELLNAVQQCITSYEAEQPSRTGDSVRYMTLDARVGERTRIARELHDTLLQSFHGVLLPLQTAFQLLPDRPVEAKEKLGSAIGQAAEAITEGRDAVQGLRDSTTQTNDLALAISTLGEELAAGSTGHRRPAFRVAVEGQSRDLNPILRNEVYKIAAEALRNAFLHANAKQVEVEIRYDIERFRLRVRDDGKGIDPAVLSRQGSEGHYGLPGMRERATLLGGKLTIWSEIGTGTEVELCVPVSAYATARKRHWLLRKLAATT